MKQMIKDFLSREKQNGKNLKPLDVNKSTLDKYHEYICAMHELQSFNDKELRETYQVSSLISMFLRQWDYIKRTGKVTEWIAGGPPSKTLTRDVIIAIGEYQDKYVKQRAEKKVDDGGITEAQALKVLKRARVNINGAEVPKYEINVLKVDIKKVQV